MHKSCATCKHSAEGVCYSPHAVKFDRIMGKVNPFIQEVASNTGVCGPRALLWEEQLPLFTRLRNWMTRSV